VGVIGSEDEDGVDAAVEQDLQVRCDQGIGMNAARPLESVRVGVLDGGHASARMLVDEPSEEGSVPESDQADAE